MNVVRRIHRVWTVWALVVIAAFNAEAQGGEDEHWAFQPVPEQSAFPAGSSIDFFVEKKLHEAGLDFSKEADAQPLVRRLYQVMVGHVPGHREAEMLKSQLDDAPETWGAVVEKVLENPGYGENIGQLWLDVARFGETDGFETNRERPDAWHYRDWVIRAFNRDMPYDQFVSAQIAGDVTGDPIGTSFLVAGPVDIVKGQDPLLGLVQRQNELDDFANTTGTAFLGMTIGCARCHDHKFDPISQEDYYAVQAVFAGVRHGTRTIPVSDDSVDSPAIIKKKAEEILNDLRSETATHFRDPVNFRMNEEVFSPIEVDRVRLTIQKTHGNSQPCIDELEVWSGDKIVSLASSGVIPSSSGDFDHPLHRLSQINDGEHGNSKSWIADKPSDVWVELTFPKPVKIDRVVWGRDRTGQFRDRLPVEYSLSAGLMGEPLKEVASSTTRLAFESRSIPNQLITEGSLPESVRKKAEEYNKLVKKSRGRDGGIKAYAGNFEKPPVTRVLYRGEPDKPRAEVQPGTISKLGSLQLSTEANESERRQQMADWIASKNNPLTARVMVNRIWQFHFGNGLVMTPNDFGTNGLTPSHPDLLDWLAREFMDNDWSVKHIHRLILQSRTWKQSSSPAPEGMARDARSKWLWRFPPRRMTAEAIRDSILKVAGTLNPKAGGPGFSAFKVDMENVRHYHPLESFGPDEWRRMVYMTRVRQEKEAVFGVFDCPDGSQSIGQRTISNTPIQALNLLNSDFTVQQAEIFADNLESIAPDSRSQQIGTAFMKAFGRQPAPAEMELSHALIMEAGIESFARAILNANEFIYIF